MPPTTPQQQHYRPWGHDISSPKPDNTTRLYYKNTNSIGTRAFTNGLTTLYQHHKELGVDISMYTATNTDWQQPTTKYLNLTHCQQIHHNAIFTYSTRNSTAGQWYQPGGTMIVATGTIASRHLETGKDATGMGRYSYQKFTGNNGTKILFIIVYRVCKEAITTAGEGTSFFHQWHELTRLGHKHLNPRRQILNDLQTIVLQAISEGTDVCITIDANESMDSNNQLFHEWIAECSLVSVHENLYDEDYYEQHPIPSTYQHGGKSIMCSAPQDSSNV
jgi:hypothetical protein